MNTKARWALVVLFGAITVLGALYVLMPKGDAGGSADTVVSGGDVQAQGDGMQTDSDTPIVATFSCAAHKSITAVFTSQKVQLTLSDGRTLTLPQARSASGARYANKDESFVFWNKGNGAFVTENGANTYDNCTALSHR